MGCQSGVVRETENGSCVPRQTDAILVEPIALPRHGRPRGGCKVGGGCDGNLNLFVGIPRSMVVVTVNYDSTIFYYGSSLPRSDCGERLYVVSREHGRSAK
jgi:hypothetical protein